MDYIERVSRAGHDTAPCAATLPIAKAQDYTRRALSVRPVRTGVAWYFAQARRYRRQCPDTRLRGSVRHSSEGQCVLSPF